MNFKVLIVALPKHRVLVTLFYKKIVTKMKI
jgi:hypothetical protein